MGSFFFAMAGLEDAGEVMLYVGLALALVATALYVRTGRARTDAAVPASSSA